MPNCINNCYHIKHSYKLCKRRTEYIFIIIKGQSKTKVHANKNNNIISTCAILFYLLCHVAAVAFVSDLTCNRINYPFHQTKESKDTYEFKNILSNCFSIQIWGLRSKNRLETNHYYLFFFMWICQADHLPSKPWCLSFQAA